MARNPVLWTANNIPGSPLADASPERVAIKLQQMDQAPYCLDQERRVVVLTALRKVCSYRNWNLLAAHVRTNHVHVVVEAEIRPETVMHAFKSYASRDLNRLEIDDPDRKRWARHGSTRWLWKDRTFRKSSGISCRGKGNQWRFTCETGRRVPLLHSRGSVNIV